MKFCMTAIFAVFLFQTSIADILIRDVLIEYSEVGLVHGVKAVLAISPGITLNEDDYKKRVERSLNEIRKNFPVDFAGSWFYDAYDGRTVVFSVAARPYYTIHGADIGFEIELYNIVCENLTARIIISENVQGVAIKHHISERFALQSGIRFFTEREAWEQILPSRSTDMHLRYTPVWWLRLTMGAEVYQTDNNTEQRSIAMKNGIETSSTTRNQFNRNGWFVNLSNDTVIWHDTMGSDYSYTTFHAGMYLPWKRFNLDAQTRVSEGVTRSNHFPMLYPFSQRYFKGETFPLNGSYAFCEVTGKFYLAEKAFVSLFINSLNDSSAHEVDYGMGIRFYYLVTVGVDYAIKSDRIHFGFIAYSF